MMHTSVWNIDQAKILSRRELAAVLADLVRNARRSAGTRMNLVIVRLACCCGLRVSEIAGLRLKHIRLEGIRPHVHVPKELAKGRRARRVPLWWDAGTLADVAAWGAERTRQGAKADDPFICSSQANRSGASLKRHALRRRFRTACKALGASASLASRSITGGILSSATLWLADEHSLKCEMRQAIQTSASRRPTCTSPSMKMASWVICSNSINGDYRFSWVSANSR